MGLKGRYGFIDIFKNIYSAPHFTLHEKIYNPDGEDNLRGNKEGLYFN